MSGTPGPVRGADVEAALAVAATQVAEAAGAATAAAPVAPLVLAQPQVGTDYLQIFMAHPMSCVTLYKLP